MFAYEASRYDAIGHRPRLRLDPAPLLRRRTSSPGRTSPRKRPRPPARRSAPAGASAPPPSGRTPATGVDQHDLPLRRQLRRHRRCNGYDYVETAAASRPSATGAASMCVSDQSTRRRGDELYDMSGNVKEWVVTDARPRPRPLHDPPCQFEMRGGAYDIASFVDNSVNAAVRGARAAVRRVDAGAGQCRRAPAVGRVPLLPARKAAELSAGGQWGALHDDS